MEILEKIVSLCKRRGFVFQNSEIYGGIQGFYDYGPLGVEMKNNIKKLWWQEMTKGEENVVGIDGAIISHPKVWEASGHLENFTDPLVDCKKCKKRFRADSLLEGVDLEEGATDKDILKDLTDKLKNKKCPECGGDLTAPRRFNLLVETSLGVVEGEKNIAYLRGEACQNIYLNYQNVLDTTHLKLPFGIIQIGKAFRNEITPKQFLFRQREFEQWDLQWFTNPKEMEKWFSFWKEKRMAWYQGLITQKDKIRFHEHGKDELAHYAKMAFDIEYQTPFGWSEWEGIHWRGDWDLSRHGKFANKDFTYTDPLTNEKFLPWIVETSGGVDRTFLFLLFDAYREEKDKDNNIRTFLALDPRVAPFKVAIFPLLRNKPELVEGARKIFNDLKTCFNVAWDDRGNIGKRYCAQDEIGTPFALTFDFDSLKDKMVTVRYRDTMKQERIAIDKLREFFQTKLS